MREAQLRKELGFLSLELEHAVVPAIWDRLKESFQRVGASGFCGVASGASAARLEALAPDTPSMCLSLPRAPLVVVAGTAGAERIHVARWRVGCP